MTKRERINCLNNQQNRAKENTKELSNGTETNPTWPSTECYLITLFPLGYFQLTHDPKNKLYIQVNKYKHK